MAAQELRAPEAHLLHSIFRDPVHRGTGKDLRRRVVVTIDAHVGVGAGLLPQTGARVFGVGVISRSNRNRWLSVAPLAEVERRGHGALGGGSLAVGIPDSLPLGSHFIQGSHPFAGVCSQHHQGQSS